MFFQWARGYLILCPIFFCIDIALAQTHLQTWKLCILIWKKVAELAGRRCGGANGWLLSSPVALHWSTDSNFQNSNLEIYSRIQAFFSKTTPLYNSWVAFKEGLALPCIKMTAFCSPWWLTQIAPTRMFVPEELSVMIDKMWKEHRPGCLMRFLLNDANFVLQPPSVSFTRSKVTSSVHAAWCDPIYFCLCWVFLSGLSSWFFLLFYFRVAESVTRSKTQYKINEESCSALKFWMLLQYWIS